MFVGVLERQNRIGRGNHSVQDRHLVKLADTEKSKEPK